MLIFSGSRWLFSISRAYLFRLRVAERAVGFPLRKRPLPVRECHGSTLRTARLQQIASGVSIFNTWFYTNFEEVVRSFAFLIVKKQTFSTIEQVTSSTVRTSPTRTDNNLWLKLPLNLAATIRTDSEKRKLAILLLFDSKFCTCALLCNFLFYFCIHRILYVKHSSTWFQV